MEKGVFFEKHDTGFGGIYLLYEAGGRFEKEGYRGISHLAEHIKCKKEKLFKRELNVLGLYTNAYTENKTVGFFCTGLDDELSSFAERYLSCFDYTPTPEDLENEKKIVLQEAKSCLCDYTLSCSYTRSMYGYGGAIGYEEDIEGISYDNFMKFYNEMLGVPSTVVFVGGNKMKKVYEKFKGMKTKKTERTPLKFSLREKPDNKFIFPWSSKSTLSVCLFSEIEKKAKSAQYVFLTRLLSDGLYSPLYDVIRENKNLVYFICLSLCDYGNSRVLELSTETGKIEEVKNAFFEIINKFDHYVTRDYYEDYVKKTLISIKQKKMKKNSMDFVLSEYSSELDSLFKEFDPSKKEFSYENMRKLCQKISKRENWNSMTHYKDKITFAKKV